MAWREWASLRNNMQYEIDLLCLFWENIGFKWANFKELRMYILGSTALISQWIEHLWREELNRT